ncbi:uracil-DNA glycosylase family protein [Paracerasibacillus soli]|uniref:Uracil-DNA glycosylase family protein n=1 Tax=Paracerasibacillus soli TaxID=480284 RepID=A0ABU5CRI3_9BACI|nr:uracil-DNA glycosylase family protein [Virgibacillus soli]MDY0408981.1 uracil-DNA glycosylase family protein [Virgibacillus soli]
MIILDNPGLREDKDGNAFVCGTRQTLQSAAHQVQLLPEDLYVTYILKRKPTRKYEKEHTRSICVHHLEAQLSKQEPSALFCLVMFPFKQCLNMKLQL